MAVISESFVIGPVGTNVYVIYDDAIREAVIVDPADRGADIYEAIENAGLTAAGILLTHGHFDHISGVIELRAKSGCKVYASELEREVLSDPVLNESVGMGRKSVSITADVELSDGDEIELGGMKFTAISTPGHTKGGMSYYLEAEKRLYCGDTLFRESVGRTDLPTGSFSEIVRSIKDKLLILPEEVIAYPGHGGETTIGDEKRYNPFL